MPGGDGPKRAERTVAAVDLGSNSFHMVVARLANDQLQVLDRLRERVVLASALGPDGRLHGPALERALDCLERFGQRLRGLPPECVRAVGTNTLRRARNARAFLRLASEKLGHAIEVIAGREEARLIYRGVVHDTEGDAKRRLVVDIGGGSTECILGLGREPRRTDSLQMGCVGFSEEYFPGGKVTRESMDQAQLAAEVELETIALLYREHGWDDCLGSSGTIRAVAGILAENGWGPNGRTSAAIDVHGVNKLSEALIEAGRTSDLALPGLSPERAPVLAGGVAILCAVLESFGIERMHASEGALREGLLLDLLGRIQHSDVREATVASFMQRYGVDRDQAERVRGTALLLLEHAALEWKLAEPEVPRLLGWAAQLHEIGLSVNYAGYQKHGAYVLENADMPGFSRGEQLLLAALVKNHRRRFYPEAFAEQPLLGPSAAARLCVLLRLAVHLNRSRSPQPLPAFEVQARRRRRITLRFPAGWLDGHPLTRADLTEEALAIAALGFGLGFE
jgi:exopolyphosphatase/guanosine-5'-triphosphate,3'-diphosphate pyrophosphatase